MATNITQPGPSPAVRALFAGGTELPLDECRDLVARLHEHLVLADHNHRWDLHPLAHGDARFIGALRSVAEVVGHAPSTPEFVSEYDRRVAVGDTGLPSVASI